MALIAEHGGPNRLPTAALLAFAVSVALLVAAAETAPARAADLGVGAGIFSVDGSLVQNLTLRQGGTYYLTVATDASSDFVNASLTYNGSLMAQENATSSASTFASLPAANYTLSFVGRGRAALGWDFTNGAVEDFPDNATLVAFLAPLGPKVDVYVSRGNAQTIALTMYDHDLLPVGNATATADGPVTFVLPAAGASVAYLVAKVTAGTPGGIYGLSWSSGPVNPPIDFTAWPWFLLWILIPVAVACAVFVLLQRRRAAR